MDRKVTPIDTRPPIMPQQASLESIALLLLAVVAACVAGGCEIFGFAAYALEQADPVTVLAQYPGLRHQSVAVMVLADEETFYRHPNAPQALCRQVSAQLAAHVPGVKVLDPGTVREFQRVHPVWFASSYGEVFGQLQTQRLLLIDLVEYNTHEPGNAHVFRGWISANVAVAEADSPNPDHLAFSTTLEARYPPNNPVGDLNSAPDRMTAALNEIFAVKVGRLFHDHEEPPPQ